MAQIRAPRPELKTRTSLAKLSTSAFTLIEILMVLTLLGIVSSIGITAYTNFSLDARIAVTNDRMAALKNAIVGDPRFFAEGKYTKQGYESHCLGLPSTLTDLVTMPGAGTCSVVYDPFPKHGWRGPYVSNTNSNWSLDGWGTTIQYNSATRTLLSCGPNLICGNGDDISLTF